MKQTQALFSGNGKSSSSITILTEKDAEVFLGKVQELSQGHGTNTLALQAQVSDIKSVLPPLPQQGGHPVCSMSLRTHRICTALGYAHHPELSVSSSSVEPARDLSGSPTREL